MIFWKELYCRNVFQLMTLVCIWKYKITLLKWIYCFSFRKNLLLCTSGHALWHEASSHMWRWSK